MIDGKYLANLILADSDLTNPDLASHDIYTTLGCVETIDEQINNRISAINNKMFYAIKGFDTLSGKDAISLMIQRDAIRNVLSDANWIKGKLKVDTWDQLLAYLLGQIDPVDTVEQSAE